jgi:hypothetical protein
MRRFRLSVIIGEGDRETASGKQRHEGERDREIESGWNGAYLSDVSDHNPNLNLHRNPFSTLRLRLRSGLRLRLFCLSDGRLPVARFEVGHEVDQCLNSGDREGVVNRGADTSHGAMALEALHAELGGLGDEEVFQFDRRQTERHIHVGATFLAGGAAVKGRRIDPLIEQRRLFGVLPVHPLQAERLEPAGDQGQNVDAETGRGVIHRLVLDVGAVAEHRGKRLGLFFGKILAKGDDRDS